MIDINLVWIQDHPEFIRLSAGLVMGSGIFSSQVEWCKISRIPAIIPMKYLFHLPWWTVSGVREKQHEEPCQECHGRHGHFEWYECSPDQELTGILYIFLCLYFYVLRLFVRTKRQVAAMQNISHLRILPCNKSYNDRSVLPRLQCSMPWQVN